MGATGMVIFAAGIAAALFYFPLTGRRESWHRALFKTVPVACFAIAAIAADAPALLGAALLLSALGDFALARPGRPAFLYGLAAFALAHVLYTLLFLGLSGTALWDAFAVAPVPALAVLLLALSTEIWLAPFAGALRWPVRAYVVLIGVMMLAALDLPGPFRPATLGAGAFVLSDMVLALARFRLRDPGRWAGGLVWGLYVGGQALILWGVAGG